MPVDSPRNLAERRSTTEARRKEGASRLEPLLASVRLLAELRETFTPSASPAASVKAELEFEIADVQMLPTELVIVSPNVEAIRSRYCARWKPGDAVPLVPGVRFRIVEAAREPVR